MGPSSPHFWRNTASREVLSQRQLRLFLNDQMLLSQRRRSLTYNLLKMLRAKGKALSTKKHVSHTPTNSPTLSVFWFEAIIIIVIRWMEWRDKIVNLIYLVFMYLLMDSSMYYLYLCTFALCWWRSISYHMSYFLYFSIRKRLQ